MCPFMEQWDSLSNNSWLPLYVLWGNCSLRKKLSLKPQVANDTSQAKCLNCHNDGQLPLWCWHVNSQSAKLQGSTNEYSFPKHNFLIFALLNEVKHKHCSIHNTHTHFRHKHVPCTWCHCLFLVKEETSGWCRMGESAWAMPDTHRHNTWTDDGHCFYKQLVPPSPLVVISQ